MADAICSKVIDAQAMMDYMFRNPSSQGGVEKVLEIYRRHISEALDRQFMGMTDKAPAFISNQINSLKDDTITYMLEAIPHHTARIEQYMDETMQIKETLSWRLQRITPDEFEDIIHPIFQQDEWILLCVGGVLGVIIGLLQAWALTSLGAS